MRLLVSWLRDFVDVQASPEEIAATLGLRGFEVASIEPLGGGDAVIDFEVTANRPDCLSVLGLAREVATALDLPLALPSYEPGAKVGLVRATTGEHARLKVTIEDAELCPRYAAAIADVTIGPSPSWMVARLQAAGVRPISSIVDITNYVLLELGHPMHAFDLATLAGGELRIRRAKPGERITTLDGTERKLEPDMLVIADANRAQAVAGVMGGAASEVSSATRAVAIESAYFKPASVRRTSKRLGLKTEASSRFERGADIGAPVVALERAMALMQQIGAGRTDGAIVDRYPQPRDGVTIHLRRGRIARLLGATVGDGETVRILSALGLAVTPAADGWDVVAPTFRVDLVREADLIEEVGRHYGFDRLAPSFPALTVPAPAPDPRIPRDQLVRRVLTAAGLSEAVTFGFIEAQSGRAVRRRSGRPRDGGEPAVGQIRHAASVARAGAGGRRRAQPPPRPARRRASSRSARASRRGPARRAASAWRGPAPWRPTGGTARGRSTSSTPRASSNGCATCWASTVALRARGRAVSRGRPGGGDRRGRRAGRRDRSSGAGDRR